MIEVHCFDILFDTNTDTQTIANYKVDGCVEDGHGTHFSREIGDMNEKNSSRQPR